MMVEILSGSCLASSSSATSNILTRRDQLQNQCLFTLFGLTCSTASSKIIAAVGDVLRDGSHRQESPGLSNLTPQAPNDA